MNNRFPLIIIFKVIVILLFTLPPGASGLEASTKCKECHEEIYYQWKFSLHATAFTEPRFKAVFDDIREKSPSRGSLCINCHAPCATVAEGPMSEKQTFEEGVTCDFCHTVKDVDVSGGFPRYVNTPGTKRGPIESAKSPYHNTEFSALILDSRFCSGCHEYSNEYGVGILTTYSEWKESYYRGKGIHCQYCHLPQLYKDKKYLSLSEKSAAPPDHRMKGGHYPGRLKETLKVSGLFRVEDESALVELELQNDKSGHRIPTGIPTHRIVVETSLRDGKGVKIAERVDYLERVLGDAAGKPLYALEDMFFNARSVLKDTRLSPKERRILKLSLPLHENKEKIRAMVSLFYEMVPAGPLLKKQRIEFGTFEIPLHRGRFPFVPIIVLLLLLMVCLVAYDVFRRKRSTGRDEEGRSSGKG